MKCLLCGLEFDKYTIKDHYIEFHKVGENSYFFKKVFSKNNKIVCQKCFRCNNFITTNLAGKYWSPGRPEDIPHQRPQDVP